LLRWLAAVAALLTLMACEMPPPDASVPVPQERPDALTVPGADSVGDARPSARSQALASYYARFEAAQVAQGLLRTDGGGVDTPFSARMLQENFEQIVFFDEYQRGAGLRRADGVPGQLRRWSRDIRFTVEHGPRATQAEKVADRAEVEAFVTRLGRITGHPMSMSDNAPNFYIIYADVDDIPTIPARVQSLVPSVNPASLEIFESLPRSIHCLVIAFSSTARGSDYTLALAVIRAEHPPLMRRSCVHEEIAQGLGLANDSPRARPSIFNDDDEFALLTTHDEMLLRILYDPDLRPGMQLEEARPIVRRLANKLTQQGDG